MSEIELDRRAELIVNGHLYEIGQTNDEVLDDRRGYHMAELGYRETLRNVADCADMDQVDAVADWIKEQIETKEERPPNRRVRRTARTIVTEAGYPANQYLNSA
jgi:hypothetical protein